MLTVHVEHYKERIQELVQQRMQGVCYAAAESLEDQYRRGLREGTSPPHSRPGQVPHAYMGHRPGGYPFKKNNTPESGTINNTVAQGFAKDQDDFLSNYIRAGRTKAGACVGFIPSHVQNRFKNYLLGWDQGVIGGNVVEKRPWVEPLFNRGRSSIRDDVRDFLKR